MAEAFDPRFGEGWTRSQCAGILPMSGVVADARPMTSATKSVGFSLVRTVADEAELLLLAVAPASAKARDRRLAARPFHRSWPRATGVRRLHLEVRDGNPAVAMYQAGFQGGGPAAQLLSGPDGKPATMR